jgi:hypothetical protein
LTDTKSHRRGLLFGYRELPRESGLWGMLLPRPGDKTVAHDPEARDVVQEIDSARLAFGNSERFGNRGFVFALTAPLILVLGAFTLGFVGISPHPAAPPWVKPFGYSVFGTLIILSLLLAHWAARSTVSAPVIISRRLRKVYAWIDKRGWVGLEYDDLVPATFVNQAVTTSGTVTAYVLVLCQLKVGTREIEYSVIPAPARGHPMHCGAIWEFIRRYMDGPPDGLPPVQLLPSVTRQPNAWMARTDRAIFGDFIDEQHRVKRSLFAIGVVWFWGSLGYWWERAAAWIERTAPRRPLPPELQATLVDDQPNPYRIVEPNEVERQAQAGTLPYMRRRWLICGVISTAIWGWLFGLIIAGVWTMR